MKIKTKVFVAMMLLLVLSVLSLCLMGLYYLYRKSSDELLANNQEILSQAQSRIESYIYDIDSLAFTLAYNTTSQTVLTRRFDSVSVYEEYLSGNYLLNVLKLYQLLRMDIRIILCSAHQPSPIYTLYGQETMTGYSYTDTEWYRAL